MRCPQRRQSTRGLLGRGWDAQVACLLLIVVFGHVAWPATAEGQTTSKADEVYWQSVKDSKNPAEIQLYLRAHPTGQYVREARQLLKDLQTGPARPPAGRQRPAKTGTQATQDQARAAQAAELERQRKREVAEMRAAQDRARAAQASELERQRNEAEARAIQDRARAAQASELEQQRKQDSKLASQGMRFVTRRKILCLTTHDGVVISNIILTGASTVSCEDARHVLVAEDEKKNDCGSPDQREGLKQWIKTESCPAP